MIASSRISELLENRRSRKHESRFGKASKWRGRRMPLHELLDGTLLQSLRTQAANSFVLIGILDGATHKDKAASHPSSQSAGGLTRGCTAIDPVGLYNDRQGFQDRLRSCQHRAGGQLQSVLPLHLAYFRSVFVNLILLVRRNKG